MKPDGYTAVELLVTMGTNATVALVAALACCARLAAADPAIRPPEAAGAAPFVLGPPEQEGPVVVRASFELQDINEIDDGRETFEFTGVLVLAWDDPRQAFDPEVAGVDEKIYQGDYQFDEISPGWYPQLVLVNESGLFQKSGVVLRVQPDGASTLIQTLDAIAEADFKMGRFPFDDHRLEAVFEVLGFDRDEVRLRADPAARVRSDHEIALPQWTIGEVRASERDRPAPRAGRRGVSSEFVLTVDIERKSFYAVRLVVFPLAVIVLLSFSVFWMDRSSLGDRLSVSFIGILTGVAYQLLMSDHLPHISYVTLMHGFLFISFMTMCATVVINLVVGGLDKQGRVRLGDLVDRRCRWAFPLAYFGLLLVDLAAAFLFFDA